MQVQKGDVIRGYDFKPMTGRGDCFVEGKVEEVRDQSMGYMAYKITVTRDVWDDEDLNFTGEGSRVGKTVFIPWRVDFMEYAGRVMNLSRV